MEGFPRWLHLDSCVSGSSPTPENLCQCKRESTEKDAEAQKMTASSQLFLNLITGIYQQTEFWHQPPMAVRTFPWKESSHNFPRPLLWALAAHGGVFLSFQFIRVNADVNYPRISELPGRRGCLIHSNIWMIAMHCDSNYEACTHPQKHPIQSNWQLKRR